MSNSRRFQWGAAYILTDIKDQVLIDEPAVYVGRKDSNMERPAMCAVCGEPLGATGYTTFCFMGPKRKIDMMIGNGCIRDRIKERKIEISGKSPYETLDVIASDLPQTGRWYGTFLHHHIAKPYVKNKKNAEKWNESILNLPGVRYIINIIDELRNDGWNLDAEKRLNCGNVDLLATHVEKGTCVFDWKSDLFFDNHDAYIRQVKDYMFELHKSGYNNICGYILWVRDEKKEHIAYSDNDVCTEKNVNHLKGSSQSIKCTLKIDMNGGHGIEEKTISGMSQHRIYGDEASFYIHSCNLSKYGYDLNYLEASPYRDGGREQFFDYNDASKGFWINFICSKERRLFTLTAFWKKIRPYNCRIDICRERNGRISTIDSIYAVSEIDDEDRDCINIGISKIKDILKNAMVKHISLIDEDDRTTKIEWDSDTLRDETHIHIPDINGKDHFLLLIETAEIQKNNNISLRQRKLPTDIKMQISPETALACNGYFESLNNIQAPKYAEEDYAKYRFTPGRIYRSNTRFYGVYERYACSKNNTYGVVKVAEVNYKGERVSDFVNRYIYATSQGKEFIYGISNCKWKIYTKDVLTGTIPEEFDCCETVETPINVFNLFN